MTTLFVAGLPKRVDQYELENLFRQCGRVESVTVWWNFEIGEAAGWAFVDMAKEWGAERAIRQLNGTFWHGRRLRVTEARSRE